MKLPLIAALLCTVTCALHAQDRAPTAISGLTANAIVTAGTGFFADSGAYRLTIGASTIDLAPITPNIFTQSFSYTYRKTGATTAELVITDRATGISGTETLTFQTPARAAFNLLSAVGSQTGVLVLEYTPGQTTTRSEPKLINVSNRLRLPAGETLTVGFVIAGDSSKTVLIRAVGPTLAQFGVTGFVADPTLSVFNSSQSIAANDNWSGGAPADAAVRVGAFALPPASRDAALVLTLAPGAYTVQAKGAGSNAGGDMLVEVYEVP